MMDKRSSLLKLQLFWWQSLFIGNIYVKNENTTYNATFNTDALFNTYMHVIKDKMEYKNL